LRNEVLASLRPDDQVGVVTGASRGAASTLSRRTSRRPVPGGSEVLLVCAHLPDTMQSRADRRLLGVNALPGLCDLLTGKGRWRPRSSSAPPSGLRVITTGVPRVPVACSSPGLRDLLARLRTRPTTWWSTLLDRGQRGRQSWPASPMRRSSRRAAPDRHDEVVDAPNSCAGWVPRCSAP